MNDDIESIRRDLGALVVAVARVVKAQSDLSREVRRLDERLETHLREAHGGERSLTLEKEP